MNINHHHHHHHDMVAAAVVSPLVHLPNDIWTYILEILIHCSPESWFKMSITCKKFAYLGFGQSTIWREICQLIYPYQKYEENQFYLQNPTLTSSIDDWIYQYHLINYKYYHNIMILGNLCFIIDLSSNF